MRRARPAPAVHPRRYNACILDTEVAMGKYGKFALLFAGKAKILTTSGSMLVSVAAYSLIWGWRFAVGFVLLRRYVHAATELADRYALTSWTWTPGPSCRRLSGRSWTQAPGRWFSTWPRCRSWTPAAWARWWKPSSRCRTGAGG